MQSLTDQAGPNLEIAPGVRETANEDGAVLLDIEQGICFSLNPVGLKIWDLLKQHYTTDKIVQALANDFPVPPSQLLADVQEFIAALEAKRLLLRPGQALPKQRWLTRVLRRLSGSQSAA